MATRATRCSGLLRATYLRQIGRPASLLGERRGKGNMSEYTGVAPGIQDAGNLTQPRRSLRPAAEAVGRADYTAAGRFIMAVLFGIAFALQSRAEVYIQCTNYPVFNGKAYVFTVTDTNALDGAGSFDWIMRNAVGPDTNVFIGPGIFATRGVWNGSWSRGDDATDRVHNKGFRVQDGCKITGMLNGTNPPTTLKLMDVVSTENTIMCPTTDFKKAYRNIAITNLILDCNAATLTTNWAYPKYLAAVRLLGRNLSVVGVTCTGASSQTNAGHQECFIVKLDGSPSTDNSTNDLVSGCVVTNFYNPTLEGTCSGIAMGTATPKHWISGLITGCAVYLNTNAAGEFCYNAGYSRSLVISNNYARGARGFNNDGGYNWGLVIVSNTFDIVSHTATGLLMIFDTSFCRVSGNTFNILNYGNSGIYICGKALQFKADGSTNYLIDHNLFYSPRTYSPVSAALHLARQVPIATHVDVEYNTINSHLSNRLSITNGYMYGNVTELGGAPLDFPPQPNPGWQFTASRADFFQDAKVDLILQRNNLDVALWSMDGASILSQTNTSPANGNGWTPFGSGDLNGDTRSDLFFWLPRYNQMGYWLLDDNVVSLHGDFKPSTVAGGFQPMAVGDFNHDLKPDIVLQNTNTGAIKVVLLDGLSPVRTVDLSLSPARYWKVAGTGDFDLDGNTDILLQRDQPGNAADGDLMIWYLDGVTYRTSQTLTHWLDPEYRVVATAHFNPNTVTNYTDLVFQYAWRTQYGGDIKMQYMTGTTTSGSPITVARSFGLLKVCGPK